MYLQSSDPESRIKIFCATQENRGKENITLLLMEPKYLIKKTKLAKELFIDGKRPDIQQLAIVPAPEH